MFTAGIIAMTAQSPAMEPAPCSSTARHRGMLSAIGQSDTEMSSGIAFASHQNGADITWVGHRQEESGTGVLSTPCQPLVSFTDASRSDWKYSASSLTIIYTTTARFSTFSSFSYFFFCPTQFHQTYFEQNFLKKKNTDVYNDLKKSMSQKDE